MVLPNQAKPPMLRKPIHNYLLFLWGFTPDFNDITLLNFLNGNNLVKKTCGKNPHALRLVLRNIITLHII